MVHGGHGNRTLENLNVVAIAAIILITTFRIKWRDMRQIKYGRKNPSLIISHSSMFP